MGGGGGRHRFWDQDLGGQVLYCDSGGLRRLGEVVHRRPVAKRNEKVSPRAMHETQEQLGKKLFSWQVKLQLGDSAQFALHAN